MKKILCLTLAAMAAVVCQAATETIGDYTWSYSVNNGEAKVTRVSPAEWSITIPSILGGFPVTSIGNSAFHNCSGLTSVTIPNSVTNIGNNAFYNCSGLTSVTIPDSVTSNGNGAFSGCSNLTVIQIDVSDMARWATNTFNSTPPIPRGTRRLFADGEEVTVLIIPDSVTSIGKSAFYNCSGLTSVTIPNSVTNIGNNAFSNCSGLTSVTIPDSVTSIGNGAFSGCSGLTSVTIPNSVTNIRDSVFSGCQEIRSVVYHGTEVSYETFLFLADNNSNFAVHTSACIRESDPTVMDVTYFVKGDTPTVNVRALAFENGDRGFVTVVRPETFIEGTEANIGDGIAANVEHRLSWKVSSDWATDLAKVKFEVLAMKPGDLLLPDMHFVTIPAAEGHPKTIISVNDLTKCLYAESDSAYYDQFGRAQTSRIVGHSDLLNALLWLYANQESDLSLSDGVLIGNNQTLVRNKGFMENIGWTALNNPSGRWSLNPNAYRYVFGKMGYRLLEGAELMWVNENTRLNLQPDQFRQYAVKCFSNNTDEISKPGLWQTTLTGQDSIDQAVDIDDWPVYRVPGPVMAFTGDFYTDSRSGASWSWTEKTVFVYRGQMWMDAGTTYTFGSNIDDWCLIKIDGVEVIRNVSCNFSSASYSCSNSGWHDIEIRVGNNGGAGGVGGSNGWKTNVGIGYNTSGLTSENGGTGWTRLIDLGDGSLLKTTGVIPKCVVFDPE